MDIIREGALGIVIGIIPRRSVRGGLIPVRGPDLGLGTLPDLVVIAAVAFVNYSFHGPGFRDGVIAGGGAAL